MTQLLSDDPESVCSLLLYLAGVTDGAGNAARHQQGADSNCDCHQTDGDADQELNQCGTTLPAGAHNEMLGAGRKGGACAFHVSMQGETGPIGYARVVGQYGAHSSGELTAGERAKHQGSRSTGKVVGGAAGGQLDVL